MQKVLFSLLCFAAVGAATPVSVSFVNSGKPAIKDSHDDQVGPYTLKINGSDEAAMCMDDFFETSGSWSADLTPVTASNLGNTYLGNGSYTLHGSSISSEEVYLIEAYLDNEILKPGADRVDIQDAAWTFMDEITGHAEHSKSTTVSNIIADAEANYSSMNASDFEIVSEVDPEHRPEQEFMVATPEPASLGLFGGALLVMGMLRIKARQRRSATAGGSAA